jgi:lantibiotic modifying enzyme
MLGDDSLIQFSVSLGDDLLATAVCTDAGMSWKTGTSIAHPIRRAHNLTGLSHGASGVALALLELYSVTRRDDYRLAACAAFAYERDWLDPVEGNWSDLRYPVTGASSRHKGRGERSTAFSTYWCHGAPGIALARLRAYELTANDLYREEAEIALGTTAAWVQNALNSPGENFSLCHGIAGNAEILLSGVRSLGSRSAIGDLASATAMIAADLGIQRYGSARRSWPCGTTAASTPGLMLGTSGIGLFYLRLHDPSIPSPLFTSNPPARIS